MAKEIGYIKFDGVDGSSTEQNHKNWSKIYFLSGGVDRPRGGDVAGTVNDRATIQDMAITKEYDKASPPLFQKSCEGKIIPKVEIHLTTSTGKVDTYLKYELEDVRLTSYLNNSSEASGSVTSRDDLRLAFKKVKVEFTSFDDKGNAGGKANGSWDVSAAKA